MSMHLTACEQAVAQVTHKRASFRDFYAADYGNSISDWLLTMA
jgi:hypothetical protein